MSDRPSPFGRMRRGARTFVYANPLYHFTLGRLLPLGRTPTALAAVPPDPWPGDANRGQALIAGEFSFAGQTVRSLEPLWAPAGVTRGWLAAFHGFDWLHDLRAAGGDAGRRQARALVESWIENNGGWNATTWAPDILGSRIAAWIGLHDFYCASADDAFRARVFDSLGRQTRHLARVLPGRLSGAPLIAALRGLIYGALNLPGGQKALNQALALLAAELRSQVLPDGGHVERSPQIQLQVLRQLVDIRAALAAARAEPLIALHHTIDRMAPTLRFFRHGDGALALFNGSQENDPGLIDAVLAQSDARGRPLRSAPHIRFERLATGRTTVLVDVGLAPPPPLDRHAHAGTLSFEMSVGRERLIVNCGAHPSGVGPWRRGLAATAAHSTLVLGDTNSAEVLEGGGLGRRPGTVTVQRQEADGAILVEASHDGYAVPFGSIHRRRLFLTDGGDDLRGEDHIEGRAGNMLAIRFHLHPSVQASLIQNGQAALLRLPGGSGWRLRAQTCAVTLEESIYLGAGDEPRRTLQVVLTATTTDGGTTIRWGLRREQRAPAPAEAVEPSTE